MDGTLLNTLNSIAYFGNKALETAGAPPIGTEGYKKHVGNGADMLIKRILKAAGINPSPEVCKTVRAQYDKLYEADPLYLVKPYDGICSLLSSVKEAGVKLAILSNKPDNMVKYIAEKFFPDIFSIIEGQQEGIPVKPNPEGILGIISKLSADKEDVLYIGDSDVDMLTGQNADVDTVGVLWGFRSEEELRGIGAMDFVSNAAQLREIILKK